MRDEIERFRAANVRPFGINPADLDSHATYAAKFAFPFPLLSDADRAVAAAYGALKTGGRRIQRTVVLIGRDGVVRFSRRGAPRPTEVLAALAGG